MPASLPTVVLVVDDEAKIRGLVRVYLEREGYTVLEAPTGGRALELCAAADLMILDLRLPYRSGEDVARQVRASMNLPIIMLTAKASESERISGLRLGADDYLSKPFSPRELMARVDAVLRRGGNVVGRDGVSFAGGTLRVDPQRREVHVDAHQVSLTRTEFDLLAALAGRPGRVWSRLELLSRVQGQEDAGERGIDAHIKNLRRKIGDQPTEPRFVATVTGIGYKLIASPDA